MGVFGILIHQNIDMKYQELMAEKTLDKFH